MQLFKEKGFTLIETLIGAALLVAVSLCIYGSFLLALKIVGQNKAKETALTLANYRIEMIHNLAYNDVGVIGGIPAGTIAASEVINKNDTNFTLETSVIFVDDAFDGIAPEDMLNTDYKRVRVKVSWAGFFGGDIILVADIAPNGIETTLGGGTLFVQVFDADGIAVPNTNVHIANNNLSPVIDANYVTNENGIILIPGAPTSTESYEISATKTGYSLDKTYGISEVANPIKNHSTVTEGGLTEVSFAIDQLAQISVKTLEPSSLDDWSDDFDDLSQISTSTNVITTSTEKLILNFENPGEYYLSGSFQTNTITPALLNEWKQLSWVDEEPSGTDIKYQIMYYDGSNWSLVPDVDFPANSIGFDSSPVNLESLDIDNYSEIRIRGNFSTDNTSTTPFLASLDVMWEKNEPVYLPNISFLMQGTKIIGTNIDEDPVYKFSDNFLTGAYGDRDVPNLEWDTYNISIASTTGYDLAASYPSGPFTLIPGEIKNIELSLVPHSENTLLIAVKNNIGAAIADASVRLYRTGYDETIKSGTSGQAFFTPLSAALYYLEVVKDGYISYIDTVNISGQTNITITLSQ